MTESSNALNVPRGLFLFLIYSNLLCLHVCTNEIELRQLLFQKRPYDHNVCPEAGVTKVHTNLILLQIESVNEKAQVLLLFSRLDYLQILLNNDLIE